MTRHTTTGNAKPWLIAKGYTYTTRQDLRLVPMRPEGEPSLFFGTLIVLAGFAVIAGFFTVLERIVS